MNEIQDIKHNDMESRAVFESVRRMSDSGVGLLALRYEGEKIHGR